MPLICGHTNTWITAFSIGFNHAYVVPGYGCHARMTVPRMRDNRSFPQLSCPDGTVLRALRVSISIYPIYV